MKTDVEESVFDIVKHGGLFVIKCAIFRHRVTVRYSEAIGTEVWGL